MTCLYAWWRVFTVDPEESMLFSQTSSTTLRHRFQRDPRSNQRSQRSHHPGQTESFFDLSLSSHEPDKAYPTLGIVTEPYRGVSHCINAHWNTISYSVWEEEPLIERERYLIYIYHTNGLVEAYLKTNLLEWFKHCHRIILPDYCCICLPNNRICVTEESFVQLLTNRQRSFYLHPVTDKIFKLTITE